MIRRDSPVDLMAIKLSGADSISDSRRMRLLPTSTVLCVVSTFQLALLPLNPIKVFLNLQLLPPPDADNEIIIIAMCQVDHVVYTCTHEDYLLPSFKPCDSVTQRNVGRRHEEMLRRARGVNDLTTRCPRLTLNKRPVFYQDRCANCKRTSQWMTVPTRPDRIALPLSIPRYQALLWATAGYRFYNSTTNLAG